jgi:hypothetical protein
MNDPQNLDLGELGQRVQAMGDPAPDSRLRPYQGAPLPVGPASNSRPIPPYEPLPRESLEDVRISPLPPLAPGPPSPDQFSAHPLYVAGSSSIPAYEAAPPTGYSTAAPNGQGGSNFASFTDPRPGVPPVQHATPEPASNWENVVAAAQSAFAGQGPSPAETSGASTPQPPSSSQFPIAPTDPNAPKSGFQRAVDAIRSTLPLVQRLLPLLDGNFATAITALVAPQTHHAPSATPVKVDLEPVERGLAEVRNSNRELRAQVQEQAASFKRVEDQLDRVREATDRNTLEQQELVEDLRSVGSRVNIFAIVGLVLLAISLILNAFLLIQLQHILR